QFKRKRWTGAPQSAGTAEAVWQLGGETMEPQGNLNRKHFFLIACTLITSTFWTVHAVMAAQATVAPSGAYQTDVLVEVPLYYGIQPRLRLVYDSSVGDGLLGVGWRFSGPSEIQRLSSGRGAPRFDSSDIYLLDGIELVRCQALMRSPSCMYPA